MAISWKTIPLHHKILAGLVLGALFGALFKVDKYELEISHAVGRTVEATVVSRWETVAFVRDTVVLETFGREDQLRILQAYRRLPKADREHLTVMVRSAQQESSPPLRIDNVRGIEKVKTIAMTIKPVGTIFIRLLMFIAIPLVLSSLIVGAASLGDIRRVGTLGGKTVLLYMVTITSAITIGLVLVNLIEPGTRLTADVLEKLKMEFQPDIQSAIPPIDLIDMVVNIVATNPINALANGEMLQIVFFALMIGISLTMVGEEKAGPVIRFFDGMSETMIKMVGMIMAIAPYGVFALISATVGEFGFDILETLVWYAVTLVLGLILHMVGFLGMLARFYSGIPFRKFFSGLREVMLVAFTTSSSGATLPVNMKACENNLGVPKKITSFVLPLGATINMDGTSMYQAVAAVFIAQVYQMDLGLAEQLTILLTAVLASIGTAPVPGVGIVMLIIVLRSVNVPEEGIALILGVDRLLDMCRTVLNVVGDAAVATIVAKSEGVLGEQGKG
ncbi:MAG: dicarboxylate:amino acid:cation symporter DAACS family protein [Bacteroidia bacterium]|nr:MAG: dicarboxylate:amino acid:cation symporter DAACS family protein [Bacteroidia bacterium]